MADLRVPDVERPAEPDAPAPEPRISRRPLLARRPSRTAALVALVAALAALALAVRLPGALDDALWADEVGAARAFTKPTLRGVLERVKVRESTPPGFYALAWGTKRAGTAVADAGAPAALRSDKLSRLWSVLFALGTVALVVLLASRLMPLPAAGLAGLLVAVGYQFVEHGKELRAYSMLALVAAALPLVLERAVERPRPGRLAALAVVVAVGSMTHYFFMLAVATGILWLGLVRPGRGAVLRCLAAMGVGVVPFLVWTPVLVHQAHAQEGAHAWVGPFSLRRVAYTYADLLGAPQAWGGGGMVARLGILAVVLAGCAVLWRTRSGRLIALLAVVPLLVTAAIWLTGQRIYDTRNLLVVGPFAAVAVAAAVAALSRRSLAVSAGVVALAVMGFAVTYELRLGRTPHDRIAHAARELGWTPARPIVLFGHYSQVIPLAWSLPKHPLLVPRVPAGDACSRAVVVAETDEGRSFLREAEQDVVEERLLPFYGNLPRGRRRPDDVRVVSVRWSTDLARAARAGGAFLLQPVGARPGTCGLVPNTGQPTSTG